MTAIETTVVNVADLPAERRSAAMSGRLVADGVYIGPGTKWGNPYRIGPDGDRDRVLALYKQRLWNDKVLMGQLHELRGKKLMCHCAPKRCHGDVLVAAIKWADANPEKMAARSLTVPEEAGARYLDQYEDDREAIMRDEKRWRSEFALALRREIQMFDTDDMSGMDMMQAAEGQCRKYDSIAEKKRNKIDEVLAEMRVLEHAVHGQLEITTTEYETLERSLRLLRGSLLKFEAAFSVALGVRAQIASWTGSRWGEYRSGASFKKERQFASEMNAAGREAVRLYGLSEQKYRKWLSYNDGYVPANSGVDALPEASGATQRSIEQLEDTRKRDAQPEVRRIDTAARAAKPVVVERVYRKRKPRAVPKKPIVAEGAPVPEIALDTAMAIAINTARAKLLAPKA